MLFMPQPNRSSLELDGFCGTLKFRISLRNAIGGMPSESALQEALIRGMPSKSTLLEAFIAGMPS
jgi:hypothetical protein